MLPIQSPDNLFRDGVPGSELGTILTAAWLNAMQAENLSILQAAGIAPSVATNQILLALRAAGVFQTAALNDNTTKAATTAFAQLLVNGRLVKSVAGGVTVNLSAVEASYAIIEFTGALTANIAVTVPNVSGHWTIKNGTTGAFTLTVKTAAGTGVAITQGLVWPVYCDGVNVLDAASDFKDIALSGISTAPTAALGTNSQQIANMAALQASAATRVMQLSTGAALPVSNIGPIWHDDYGSIMTWQTFNANGAAYVGYASTLIGNLLQDTQPTPRTGYIKSGTQNLSRTTYAALRAWAMHNGLMVALGAWVAGGLMVADNADGTTFRIYDVRGEFPRFWDDGRGVDAGRVFGGTQASSATLAYVHSDGVAGTLGALSVNAVQGDSLPNSIILNANYAAYAGSVQNLGSTYAGVSGHRPRNTAFSAQVKF